MCVVCVCVLSNSWSKHFVTAPASLSLSSSVYDSRMWVSVLTASVYFYISYTMLLSGHLV